MTATTHTLTGIGLATLITNPVLLILVAFGSHLVLDALPHFGMPGVNYRSKKFIIYLVSDLALMMLLVVLAIAALSLSPLLILLGVGAAVAPDVLHVRKLMNREELFPRFQNFHAKIQWYEKPSGFVIEVIFSASLAAIVF